MKELCFRVRMWESHAKMFIELLEAHCSDPNIVALYKKEVEIARGSALEVEANWEMGIVEDFLKGPAKGSSPGG